MERNENVTVFLAPTVAIASLERGDPWLPKIPPGSATVLLIDWLSKSYGFRGVRLSSRIRADLFYRVAVSVGLPDEMP